MVAATFPRGVLAPLAYQAVGEGEIPVFILHGILGRGRNLAGLARRLATAREAYRFVLVDLRNHGDSLAGSPPDTLEACAEDLAALADAIGPPRALIAHSFGTKVALLYARRREVERLWLLDAPPGARAVDLEAPGDNPVLFVLAVLRNGPRAFASRRGAVENMMQAGLTRPIAEWLATNLVEGEGGLGWRFDLARIDAMILDYYAHDLWPELESPRARLHFVRGGKSDRLVAECSARLSRLASEGKLDYHVLEQAGHWLHSDDLEGLARLIEASL